MKVTRAIGLITISACAVLCLGASQQPKELDRRIPEAIDEQLKFQNNSDWHNPFVVVRLDGVTVFVREEMKAGPIQPEELARVLIALPLSAWPRGRAVALSQSSRIPFWIDGYPEPTHPCYILRKKVDVVLRDLKVRVVGTPVN